MLHFLFGWLNLHTRGTTTADTTHPHTSMYTPPPHSTHTYTHVHIFAYVMTADTHPHTSIYIHSSPPIPYTHTHAHIHTCTPARVSNCPKPREGKCSLFCLVVRDHTLKSIRVSWPRKLCGVRVAINYTPLSMAYHAYDSTANFLSLGSTMLICISKERRCKEDLRGVRKWIWTSN